MQFRGLGSQDTGASDSMNLTPAGIKGRSQRGLRSPSAFDFLSPRRPGRWRRLCRGGAAAAEFDTSHARRLPDEHPADPAPVE